MRTGYPTHMNIDDLFKDFKLNFQEFFKLAYINQKEFYCLLIRSCGLKWNDFRLGNRIVFFRNGKANMLTDKLKDDCQLIINRYQSLVSLRAKWRIILIATRFCTIGKRRRVEDCTLDCATPDTTAIQTVNVNVKNSTMRTMVKKPQTSGLKKKTNKKRKLENNIPDDISSSQIEKSTSRRTTITIPSNENRTVETVSTENLLRKLLREEREKNAYLTSDYHKLQQRNLDLLSNFNNIKKENERLIRENKILRSETEPPLL